MQKVLITEASYKDCRRAIELALSTFPLPVRGRRVLVKVNAMTGTEPEQGTITHPSVLRALVALLEEMGPAEILVGDNPGGGYYGRNRDVFADSGLLEASGGHYCNFGRVARAVPFNPEFVERVFPSSVVLDSDIYISVPKFKTHTKAGVSIGLKNNFGILPGAQKANLHHRARKPVDFGRMLMEVYRLRPPDLIIVDAILSLHTLGPYSPDLYYTGLIMASDNGVALDATAARMMGYDPAEVPIIRAAHDGGLGSLCEEDIQVLGNLQRIPGFKIPPVEDLTTPQLMKLVGRMAELPHYRPRLDAAKCDGCSLCADGCPAGALAMADGLPRLEASVCVPCFCCKEVCPREAIEMLKPDSVVGI